MWNNNIELNQYLLPYLYFMYATIFLPVQPTWCYRLCYFLMRHQPIQTIAIIIWILLMHTQKKKSTTFFSLISISHTSPTVFSFCFSFFLPFLSLTSVFHFHLHPTLMSNFIFAIYVYSLLLGFPDHKADNFMHICWRNQCNKLEFLLYWSTWD